MGHYTIENGKLHRTKYKNEIHLCNQTYRAKNPEKIRQMARARYAKNKEEMHEWNRNYRKQHPLTVAKIKYRYYDKRKMQCFQHYSPELKCQKCGFDDIRALSIDHIDGNGRAHRKQIGGVSINIWLVTHGYPPGYQVLCMNCQFIKKHERQEMPGRQKVD